MPKKFKVLEGSKTVGASQPETGGGSVPAPGSASDTPRADAAENVLDRDMVEVTVIELARQLERENAVMRKALVDAARRFRVYVEHHGLRRNAIKEQSNRVMAEMCEAALSLNSQLTGGNPSDSINK